MPTHEARIHHVRDTDVLQEPQTASKWSRDFRIEVFRQQRRVRNDRLHLGIFAVEDA